MIVVIAISLLFRARRGLLNLTLLSFDKIIQPAAYVYEKNLSLGNLNNCVVSEY